MPFTDFAKANAYLTLLTLVAWGCITFISAGYNTGQGVNTTYSSSPLASLVCTVYKSDPSLPLPAGFSRLQSRDRLATKTNCLQINRLP